MFQALATSPAVVQMCFGIERFSNIRYSDTLLIPTKQLLIAKPQGKQIQVCPSRMIF